MILLDTRQLARNISQLLRNALYYTRTGQLISKVMTDTTRAHVKHLYPLSKHWNPEKIVEGPFMNDWGSVDVNVEGASKAYHDVRITPNGKFLTIPIHSESYGKKASDFEGLFRPKGKNILAKVMNGELAALFAIVNVVVQKQNKNLLPSDDRFANTIEHAWIEEFWKTADKENRWN